MNNHTTEKLFPLSLSQQNIWNLERSLLGTSVNNICTTVRLRGHLDFPLLQKSIHMVLEKDSSMRTRLVQTEEGVMQYHLPYEAEDFPVYDFSNTSKEGIENWEIAVTREPIPLEEGPLYRFVLFKDGEGSGGMLVKIHHIISDGWSQVMICNKIAETYLELLGGKEVSLEETPSYELHVQEEQDYLASKAYARDEKYWKKIVELSGEPSSLKHVNSAAVSSVGRRMSFELPQILNHAIYAYCQEKRVAPFAVFYMALAIYFKRIGGADRFVIGVPIFNRTSYQFKQSSGMFVTTVPFYNEINDEWNLNEFNDHLMEAWYEMLRHQRFPFAQIAKMAGAEDHLFNIALSYQDSKIFSTKDASVELTGRWHYSGYQAEQLTIHLTNLYEHQRYAVDYSYLAQFFAEEEIIALHEDLCEILNEALNDPEKPIHRLCVLSIAEKERLLYTFNNTDRYLEEIPVYDALVRNSSEYQNRVAVICNGERTTYGSFLYKSAAYAGALAKCGVKSDELVALLIPRSPELLQAMVGTLQAGCGYLVLSTELPVERIRKILEQSEARVVITTEDYVRRVGDCEAQVLTVEEVEDNGTVFYTRTEEERSEDKPLSQRLAYVVYTSGSTGEPKGVEITHRNLLNLAQEMKDIYGQGAVLSVCNVGFDAFMLESIVALLNGRTIVLPADEELEAPERLAALINGHAVGYFSMTPSRLAAFLQNRMFRRSMRKLESVLCGGEAFPAELLKKLKQCCNARIYNQYGPSETTVGVTLKDLTNADRITIGHPMGNCRMYVLDKWMNPLPAGGYGDLYVGGMCVGRGYRNQPELTEKVFRKNPFVTDDTIYFTGDVATWTADGELVLTGRVDDQVKLRGLRVELQEVASCIETYPGVTSAIARICELNGQQILGVYYCSEDGVGEAQLLSHAATYLPRYMIPSFLIRMDAIPMTSNGKVDEKRLPLPDTGSAQSSGELTATAEAVLAIFRQVLQNEEIYGDSDYFLCGGNSLNAMECVMALEDQLGRKLRIADLYACRTASKVAAYLDGKSGTVPVQTAKAAALEKKPAAAFGKASLKEDYPLTPVQQGMYIQTLLDESGLSYNMPGAFRLEEKPDEEKLAAAFAALVREEPLFRTVYVQSRDGIRARILDKVSFEIEQLLAEDFEEACRLFVRPFNFAKAPFLRAALWQSKEEEWYLFLDSHHIVGDGMSTPLILKRLDQAYGTGMLNVEWNYYDYIYELQQNKNSEKQQELKYWTDHLQALPEPLVLPGDNARPKKFDFKGTTLEELLSEEETRACDEYCARQGMSGFVLFLSAYGILLSAISGREDFVIGAPVAGRTMSQTREICGPFINTLPLRLRPSGKISVREWMKKVQDEVAGMLDHQHTSLEEIIQEMNLPRGEQNALYQVMFTQSPVDEDAFCLDGKRMRYCPIESDSVKMDLVVEMARKEACYALRFSYATTIFDKDTIAFYTSCFKQILRELMKNPDTSLENLRILSPGDYQKYVEIPNYEVTPFVKLPLHKLIYNKSQSVPNQTSVIFQGRELTYAQMERRSAAIARFLEDQNVQVGQCIGLCLSRTPDMIAAMYGILKAGCAYVFMLPTFPASRLNYMLEVSGAQILLYDRKAKTQMPEEFFGESMPCRAFELPEGEVDEYTDRPVRDEDLVNVLFTSGSTGKPKGVMLTHRSVSNLYLQVKSILDPVEGTLLCSTNSVFDCFLMETLVAMAIGRTIVLADDEEMMLPWKMAKLMEAHETAVFEMTPSRLQMCLGNEDFCKAARHIKILLVGGEALTKNLMDKFLEHSDGMLVNMYGPTEGTIYTTMGPLKAGDHITIGRPLQNIRTYVVDEQLRPVIPTACGELCIAGECLAAGYISRPDLTEKAFVEDIYFPGEKMYRTGDIVRLRTDGQFDYIGRKDAQVKLNGQRVELGEITGAILESGHAKQAATVPVRKADGSMELCSFYETDSADGAKEAILSHLKKVLTAYMIPSRLIRLERMPITATNKIDMSELRKLAEAGIENMSEPAADASLEDSFKSDKTSAQEVHFNLEAGVTTEYILSVWNRVLSVPVNDPEASFFEQGGTSMGALNVLSYYFNDHLEMSLAEFYENPTAAKQVLLLGGTLNASEQTKKTTEPDYGEMPEPERNPIPAEEEDKPKTIVRETLSAAGSSKFESVPKKPVLVSGATGFFGAHLVKELVTRKYNVICLMRDGNTGRLRDCLEWYFGQGFAMYAKEYLKVVKGDIAKPRLGLAEDNYARLADMIGEVYHCAADVRHYAADEKPYMKTNVDGTVHMLELAQTAGVPFYHMSTLSVSGECLKGSNEKKVFTELDFDIGQIWENNIYVRSKFLAEKHVLEAAGKGADVKIFRLGRLVGRASDGVFQRNPETNAFHLLMKGFGRLGVVPENAPQEGVDLMPVDIAVEEVLALKNLDGQIYHIMSHVPPTLEEVVRALDVNIPIVSEEEFEQIVTRETAGMDRELFGLVRDHWHRIKYNPPAISVSNSRTMKALEEVGYDPVIPAPEQLLKGFSIKDV